MKKDFETAYKELANTEVPDLWDRIEAGLSEKSAPTGAKSTKTTEEGKDSAPIHRKTKIAVFMRKYSVLAAAIVCAIILIPTMVVMKKAGDKSMSESAADMAFTAESAYYEDVEAQEPAEAVPEMMEESSAMTEAVAEAADMEQEEAAKEMKTESAMAAELKNIIVKVKNIEERPLKNEVEEAGILYTAQIEENPSGLPKEGEEIQIFIPVVSSVVLAEDGTFELDLALSEREENVYTVTGYHGEVKE